MCASGLQIRVNVTEEETLELVMKEDPCNSATQPHFFSVQMDWTLPEVRHTSHMPHV